jgi:hypothetical protein
MATTRGVYQEPIRVKSSDERRWKNTLQRAAGHFLFHSDKT